MGETASDRERIQLQGRILLQQGYSVKDQGQSNIQQGRRSKWHGKIIFSREEERWRSVTRNKSNNISSPADPDRLLPETPLRRGFFYALPSTPAEAWVRFAPVPRTHPAARSTLATSVA
jgi:hypothetical protein